MARLEMGKTVVQKWLQTDPFDIALEDLQTEVAELLGVEQLSPRFDSIMQRLDEVYLRNRSGNK